MRDYKFRAWDKSFENMIYGNVDIYNSPKHWEIMQFTGLLDKSGKEIYEGDIVSLPPYWTEEVKWAEIRDPELGEIIGYGYTDKFESGEIIGNVYENPELLRRSR